MAPTAPTAPKKRSSIRNKAFSASTSTPKVHEPRIPQHATLPLDTSGFLSTKRDKRHIKHSSFVNRIEKARSDAAGASQRRRRRPGGNLLASLTDLVDALPSVGQGDGEGQPALSNTAGMENMMGMVRIRQRTVKTRPGAMKRREKAEKLERERFGKNLAQLMSVVGDGGDGLADATMVGNGEQAASEATRADLLSSKKEPAPSDTPSTSATTSRWAALRGFITQTMEQKAEFRNP